MLGIAPYELKHATGPGKVDLINPSWVAPGMAPVWHGATPAN